MSYALFSKGQQISKAFATAAEVWDHADTAGLVEYYEKNGHRRRALAEHYTVEKVQASNDANSRRDTLHPAENARSN